jgi:hypothetical protein
MNKLQENITRMMLYDCNHKISEFQEICNYLTQYSQVTSFLIPVKYKTTIENYLNDLEESLVFEFHNTDDPNLLNLILFNYGVVQKEGIIAQMKNMGAI